MALKDLRKQLVEALVILKLDLTDVVLYPLSLACSITVRQSGTVVGLGAKPIWIS